MGPMVVGVLLLLTPECCCCASRCYVGSTGGRTGAIVELQSSRAQLRRQPTTDASQPIRSDGSHFNRPCGVGAGVGMRMVVSNGSGTFWCVRIWGLNASEAHHF